MFQKALITISAIVLLQFCNAASAFTLITLPQEQLTPSNAITDSLTLDQQIQPITSAIRAHLFGARRAGKSKKTAQYGGVLAANSHADRISDVDAVTVAYNDLASAEGGGVAVGGGGSKKGMWITSAYSSLKNDFSRTSFDGDIHSLLGGFDFTQSDKYILGIAVSHETSRFDTKFNVGNEKSTGFNFSPYFALLLSDTLSFDLSLGYGKYNTNQSRAVAVIAVPLPVVVDATSDFSSKRTFVSTNATYVSAWGNWKLTESLGVIAAKQKHEAYIESNGASVNGSSQSRKQWNLAGEAAYSHGDSESYVGLVYERTRNPDKIQFTSGEQPANDPDSFLLSAGWRHFGKEVTAGFVVSARLGQDQATESGFSTTIRIDF